MAERHKKCSKQDDQGEDGNHFNGYFNNIPYEIYFHILSRLSPSELLHNISLVNWYFYTLSRNDKLWNLLYRLYLKDHTKPRIFYNFNDFYFTKRLLHYKRFFSPGFPKNYNSNLEGWLFNKYGINQQKYRKISRISILESDMGTQELWDEYSDENYYDSDDYVDDSE